MCIISSWIQPIMIVESSSMIIHFAYNSCRVQMMSVQAAWSSALETMGSKKCIPPAASNLASNPRITNPVRPLKFELKNRRQINFWNDSWIMNSSLKNIFSILYSTTARKKATMADLLPLCSTKMIVILFWTKGKLKNEPSYQEFCKIITTQDLTQKD